MSLNELSAEFSVAVCRRYDDPEPFDVNGGRGDEVESYRQHPSSEPQLRRVQSRSQLETQKPADDVFVSLHLANFTTEYL